MLFKDILAIWGAVLSTVLGIIQVLKHFREKPEVEVDAGLLFKMCGEQDEVKGTKINFGERGWNEVLLTVTIINSGNKSIQITAILIEDNKGNIIQVTSDKLPTVLEPRTSVEVEIQKEWIDKTDILFFGVIDALGKRHSIKTSRLQELLEKTNELPTNKRKYQMKDDPSQIVEGFQIKDQATFIRKETR